MENIKFLQSERGREVMRCPLFTEKILNATLKDYFLKLRPGEVEKGGHMIIDIMREYFRFSLSVDDQMAISSSGNQAQPATGNVIKEQSNQLSFGPNQN